ncbi:oocyte zinc finger protein XlCOF22-like [Hyla sarda]|uniref:oocyte zinc finger protein XlCOF22-like n=1 Tax=Hyla sarda TaxID=327740 RepID=UPI0024C3DCD4|nr:oocyte zinc finger protein XlCOF22-like [Hyla sarda]
MDKSHMIDKILNLTVDIIYLLTEEEYCVVNKRSGERLFPSSNAFMLLGWNRTQSVPNQDKNNEQEILEITNQIIHLLTGEGEDLIDIKVEVTEKEELFGSDSHKCEEEEETPVTIITDEYFRSSNPLHAQDPPEQHTVLQDEKDGNLYDANGTVCRNGIKNDNYQKIGQLCKEEEIHTDVSIADGLNCRSYTDEECDMLPSVHETEYNIFQGSPCKTKSLRNNHLIPPGCGNSFPNTTHVSEQNYITLRDKYSITLTLQQDHPEEEKLFSCPECGKGFTKKSSLVRHQIIHIGEKPFSCIVCSKSFARKSTLVEHKKTHTCEKPYSCSDCGKCFVRKANLLDHQRIHTGERLFSCPICPKSFTNKTILVRHQKSHTGEKPFSCSECGKCFGHKSVLVKHKIVHTGEKPFPCSECGKCFTQKGNLMEHQKVHTGERLFFCSYCGKSFTNKAVLMRHQVTHSKQRPLSCLQCGKCFMHKANLTKHEKSHMAETPGSEPKALSL